MRTRIEPTVVERRADFWNAPPDALLPRKTVAVALNVSRNWLEKAAIEGKFVPYIKIGSRCLYRKGDVTDWIETHGKRVVSTRQLTEQLYYSRTRIKERICEINTQK